MFKKIVCSALVLSLVFGLCNNVSGVYAKEKDKKEVEKKGYIVISKDYDEISQIESKYIDEVTCDYNEYSSDNGEIVSVSLSEEDVDEIEENDDIVVEEDVIVEACGRGEKKAIAKKRASKKVKGLEQVYKQMIKADNVKKEKGGKKDKDKENKKNNRNNPVKIAIIDSGIDDCSDVSVERRINLVPGEEELTPFLEDQTGHGTAVAGIIAGKGEDTGVVGINNDVLIYSAKVLDGSNSAPLSRVIEGIYWAIDNDVDIINMSFGIDTESEALKLAVDKAVEKDILVVAAVGNTATEAETEQEMVETFEVPDCVTGQWTGEEHKKFITNAIDKTGISLTATEIAMIKTGCVFNDSIDYKNSKGKTVSLRGLKNTEWGDNGDWHGSKKPGYNYVTAFAFTYYLAYFGVETYNYGCDAFQPWNQYQRMKKGIKRIYENGNSGSAMAKAIIKAGGSVTKNNTNHFMLGMSLHILSDTFAHATYEKTSSGWKYIAHYKDDGTKTKLDHNRDGVANPDDKEYIEERHAAAKRAVRKAMALYKNNSLDILKVYDLEEGEYYNNTKYKLQGLYSRACVYNGKDLTGRFAELLLRNSYNSASDKAIAEASRNIKYGTAEQKAELKKLLCNPTFYYWVYTDIRNAIPYNEQELRNHYNLAGIYEGRVASPLFNPGWYMEQYEDVAEHCNGNYQKAYEHFVNYGFWEGRKGSMFFDAEFYLETYANVWKKMWIELSVGSKTFYE